MQKTMKKIITAVFGILLFPIAVFAQGLDLGLLEKYQLPGGTIYGILSNLLSWLLILFGIFGVLGFVISGIMYLVSAGDDDMIARAKKGMMYSIVGVIVGLSGLVIIFAIANVLNSTPY